MADLNEKLLWLLDGPGPQLINLENKPELLRGSNGAQHVKIVDQNGNPISSQQTEITNLPENYPDLAVKEELEEVKAELQSLKEHTFNTQLTGSNVEHSDNPKPQGQMGDTLFLWDTRQVFLHDGTEWREV